MAEGLDLDLRQRTPIPLDARLTCGPGELLVLVGPSGAGKTTILRAIAGLTTVTEGRIVMANKPWFDAAGNINLAPQARRVGLVFQEYALFPHMTAEENIVQALGHLPANARRERARALLAQVNLDGLAERRPQALSGGQRQRVALARALARDPHVLLMDEPFAAVDQVTRRRLQDQLVELRQALETPTILVTHDLNEARNLGDRICVLHHGRTLQTGPPETVMNRPASPEVARLVDLGNLFPGRILSRDTATGETRLDWRGVTLQTRTDLDLGPDQTVSWVVPQSFIVLHRRDRPSRGERENPIAGAVTQVRVLGETSTVTMVTRNDPDRPLTFSLPAHTQRRNGVTPGAEITVSLLSDGIHVMADDRL